MHQPLSKLKRDTVYTLVQDGNRSGVLRASADRSASLYVAPIKPALSTPVTLSWDWKTDALVAGADNREKDREDAPLRVLVAFDGDLATLPDAEQKRFSRAKNLAGRELPYAVLMYIWTDQVPVGTVIPSAHTSQVKMLAVASGKSGLGAWQTVQRNLAEDYRRAYGAEPGPVVGVAVMTDTDNTGTQAVGQYAGLRIACAGQVTVWRLVAAAGHAADRRAVPACRSSYERSESHALQDTASTALGQAGREPLQAHPGQSAFRPLPSGVDALVARMLLAEAAERSLDVQYYIWHDDLTGRLFAHALLRAADRGVRVRILVDDVGTKANDETLLSLDAHPQIEVRLFNPVASRTFRGLGMLTDFSRTNRRMHNKAFVADNQRAVLGGRNIGDEYFEAHGDVAFGDLDVLTLGPVVAEVSEAFDLFWNAPMSIPIGALTGRLGAGREPGRAARTARRLRRSAAATALMCARPGPPRRRAWRLERTACSGVAGMWWSTTRPRSRGRPRTPKAICCRSWPASACSCAASC